MTLRIELRISPHFTCSAGFLPSALDWTTQFRSPRSVPLAVLRLRLTSDKSSLLPMCLLIGPTDATSTGPPSSGVLASPSSMASDQLVSPIRWQSTLPLNYVPKSHKVFSWVFPPNLELVLYNWPVLPLKVILLTH